MRSVTEASFFFFNRLTGATRRGSASSTAGLSTTRASCSLRAGWRVRSTLGGEAIEACSRAQRGSGWRLPPVRRYSHRVQRASGEYVPGFMRHADQIDVPQLRRDYWSGPEETCARWEALQRALDSDDRWSWRRRTSWPRCSSHELETGTEERTAREHPQRRLIADCQRVARRGCCVVGAGGASR